MFRVMYLVEPFLYEVCTYCTGLWVFIIIFGSILKDVCLVNDDDMIFLYSTH